MKRGKKAGTKPAKKSKNTQQNEMFNFDNEIVIGVTKLPDPKPKKKKKPKKPKQIIEKEVNKEKIKNAKQNVKKSKPNKKIDLKKEKRKQRIKAFIKGMIAVTIIIGAMLALSLSPLFKLEKIEVEGNSKVTNEEIINLSKIQKGNNIFLVNNNSVINKIKENSYIENVKIKKLLPDRIVIEVEERQATYALKYEEKYIYINNQGYILEIAESTNNLPQILSYRTSIDKIKVGGRLSEEDLELLGTVLKIMEAANNNGIGNLITSIDIANKNDIILRIESER